MTAPSARMQPVRYLLFLLGAASLTIASVDQARWGIAQSTAEPGTLAFGPWYGEALALINDRDLTAKPSDQLIVARAHSSLVGQALNARALRQLAALEDSSGHEEKSLALIQESTAVTRRDIGTQIWLVNHYAQAGNVKQALAHYDLALRGNGNATSVLFPILTNALGAAEVRSGIASFIRSDVPWMPAFLDYASAHTQHPESFAVLLVEAGGLPLNAAYRGILSSFLSRLISMNKYDLARRTYLALHAGPVELLTAPDFVIASADNELGPFGWELTTTPTFGATLSSDESGLPLSMEVFAAANETARVARKLMYLHAGEYKINIEYFNTELRHGVSVTWRLECIKDLKESNFWKSAHVPGASTSIRSTFLVPKECDAIYLDLIVSGGDEQIGSDFRIQKIVVVKS